jgi:hypothetical protein
MENVSAASPVDLGELLEERGEISARDLRELGDGFIAKEIDVADRSAGLALIGVMRLDKEPGSVHAAMSRAGDILGRTEVGINELNVIAEPPADDEFAAYELTQVEKEALETCELGDCRVKLPQDLIELVADLDYAWEEDAEPFTAAYRGRLTDLVRAYRKTGNAALWTYRDKENPLHALDGFRAALNEAAESVDIIPNVAAYLLNYPKMGIEGNAEEFLFWSVLDFGQRPTLTVNHIVSVRPANPRLDYLLVIKNIYANHYFGGRMTIGAILAEGVMEAPGNYFVLVDHLEFDGKLNRLLRGVVSRGIRNDMENRLRFIRELIYREP